MCLILLNIEMFVYVVYYVLSSFDIYMLVGYLDVFFVFYWTQVDLPIPGFATLDLTLGVSDIVIEGHRNLTSFLYML